MQIADRTFAKQIADTFTTLDVKPPAAVAKSYDTTLRISRACAAMAVRPEDVYGAVHGALDAGRDPASDPDVQRILAAGQIQNPGVTAGVDDLAYGAHRAVCREHAVGTVAAWRATFDKAASVLTAAFARIGDLDLADAGAVLAIGGDSSEVWAKAQSAVATIRTIATGWYGLAAFTGHDPGQRHTLLRIADINPAVYIDANLDEVHGDAWHAVRNGWTLSLPTLDQYEQRVAAVNQARADEQDQAARLNQYAMTGRRAPSSVA